MKTTFEHKYNIGDRVYFILNSDIQEGRIDSMEATISKEISIDYRIAYQYGGTKFIDRTEDNVYKSIVTE